QRGYDVLLAADGAEALAHVNKRGAAIDLIISDVVLPGLSGPEVVACVREKVREIRVLLMSGYSDHHALRGLRHGEHAILHKPFSSAAIARKVREVLDRREAAAA
ncbi:MAG TPA: response regulator, partial [Kofleriaceae bacterium]